MSSGSHSSNSSGKSSGSQYLMSSTSEAPSHSAVWIALGISGGVLVVIGAAVTVVLLLRRRAARNQMYKLIN